jgi:hypothetical protein
VTHNLWQSLVVDEDCRWHIASKMKLGIMDHHGDLSVSARHVMECKPAVVQSCFPPLSSYTLCSAQSCTHYQCVQHGLGTKSVQLATCFATCSSSTPPCTGAPSRPTDLATLALPLCLPGSPCCKSLQVQHSLSVLGAHAAFSGPSDCCWPSSTSVLVGLSKCTSTVQGEAVSCIIFVTANFL